MRVIKHPTLITSTTCPRPFPSLIPAEAVNQPRQRPTRVSHDLHRVGPVCSELRFCVAADTVIFGARSAPPASVSGRSFCANDRHFRAEWPQWDKEASWLGRVTTPRRRRSAAAQVVVLRNPSDDRRAQHADRPWPAQAALLSMLAELCCAIQLAVYLVSGEIHLGNFLAAGSVFGTRTAVDSLNRTFEQMSTCWVLMSSYTAISLKYVQ